jgi:hypothetical protein
MVGLGAVVDDALTDSNRTEAAWKQIISGGPDLARRVRRNFMTDNRTINVERAAGANPDPITGEPGSHPVGTGVGSAGGAAAGAAIGAAVGGPVGAVVGGVAGAMIGGGAGHAAGEGVNPTAEKAYWEKNYKTRSYYSKDRGFDSYEPGYRYGWENAGKSEFAKKSFEETEPVLQQRWSAEPGVVGRPSWADSREPVRDAWMRVRDRNKKDA